MITRGVKHVLYTTENVLEITTELITTLWDLSVTRTISEIREHSRLLKNTGENGDDIKIR